MSELSYQQSLPPYRSLVNPNLTYDYQTHRVIHLSPPEIKKIIARFQSSQSQKPKSAFQMKYRSLLSDVSLKASILSRKVSSLKPGNSMHTSSRTQSSDSKCESFQQLPLEVQIAIFTYIDDQRSYLNCLYTSKEFYHLAKPFLYESVSFTSTYRFAQFVTCLRLNSGLGEFVSRVDLSTLRPGNADVDTTVEENFHAANSSEDADLITAYLSQVLAGWRDWKFKNNLHALHPVAVPMSRSSTSLASAAQSQSGSKRMKLTKYFKRRKSQSNVIAPSSPPLQPKAPNKKLRIEADVNSIHPRINKFLITHASSKDLPVGYVLHLIYLCPNLKSLNLGGLSLSTDYKVAREFQSRYQSYDLMNNYHKDMLSIVESLNPPPSFDKAQYPDTGLKSSFKDLTSSASSVFSIGAFSGPTSKYNSLLPPVKFLAPDIQYAYKGDGNVFLSDLSLKSINASYLETIQPKEIFRALQRRQANLQYLDMSSMIWVNVSLVREYLHTQLASDFKEIRIDGKNIISYKGKRFDIGQPAMKVDTRHVKSKKHFETAFNFSDCGMVKNSPWAQLIDTSTTSGERIVYRIINNELLRTADENIVRERIRRGRAGENYF